jgi:manganese-dependent inorganic pyrophosphatase
VIYSGSAEPAGLPELPEGCIVICGNQPDVISAALESEVGCLIVCESEVDRTLVEGSKKTCVISTLYDAYAASRLVFLAIPVSRICRQENLFSFHLNDYVDDVREATLKSRSQLPDSDDSDCVVGTLSRFHLLRPNRKRVVWWITTS